MIISKLFTQTAGNAQALPQSFLLHRKVPLVLALCMALYSLMPGHGQAVLAQQVEPAAQVQTVNINKADAQTLASLLNGVGPSRAEEIIRYREAYGPFKSLDELAEVDGIGPSTLNKNRKVITLD